MSKKTKKKEDEDCTVMCCHDEGVKGMALAKGAHGALFNLGKMKDRGNVVMTRLGDEDLTKMDALVEVDVFKSRSEAAAFFIKEGIQARKDIVEKVMPTVDKIRELKNQAKKSLGTNEP